MAYEILPVVLGIASILTVAIVANIYFSSKKGDKSKKSDSSKPRTLLDPNVKYQLPLIEKETISHDTRRFRFGLPSPQHVLGLPVGQHIHLIANIDDELVIRAYTPVSSDENEGYVDLVIKVYKRNVHPKFPNGGKMSQFVDALNIGDTISFRGPTGKLQYAGNGKFSIKRSRTELATEVEADKLNMIAGGTGITPMLQLVREIIAHPPANKQLKLALLFANQTEDDILLRKELDELAEKHSEQFKVWYTVDQANDSWKYSTGFVNADMIKEHLHEPAANVFTMMCGPPPMINYACIPNLDALGYSSELRFAY